MPNYNKGMWYWFPYHQGCGVLRWLQPDNVADRLHCVLFWKPEDELGVRMLCWVPVKDQAWAERHGYQAWTARHGHQACATPWRKQFVKEYPKLEIFLDPNPERFELNFS